MHQDIAAAGLHQQATHMRCPPPQSSLYSTHHTRPRATYALFSLLLRATSRLGLLWLLLFLSKLSILLDLCFARLFGGIPHRPLIAEAFCAWWAGSGRAPAAASLPFGRGGKLFAGEASLSREEKEEEVEMLEEPDPAPAACAFALRGPGDFRVAEEPCLTLMAGDRPNFLLKFSSRLMSSSL
mmetsp:Transcript_35097/g.56443  ORF Transcript_35097/g.56443 Transcript_35097/m.56443 type:complete len:183 (+) Transcript_35097:63-611(+)